MNFFLSVVCAFFCVALGQSLVNTRLDLTRNSEPPTCDSFIVAGTAPIEWGNPSSFHNTGCWKNVSRLEFDGLAADLSEAAPLVDSLYSVEGALLGRDWLELKGMAHKPIPCMTTCDFGGFESMNISQILSLPVYGYDPFVDNEDDSVIFLAEDDVFAPLPWVSGLTHKYHFRLSVVPLVEVSDTCPLAVYWEHAWKPVRWVDTCARHLVSLFFTDSIITVLNSTIQFLSWPIVMAISGLFLVLNLINDHTIHMIKHVQDPRVQWWWYGIHRRLHGMSRFESWSWFVFVTSMACWASPLLLVGGLFDYYSVPIMTSDVFKIAWYLAFGKVFASLVHRFFSYGVSAAEYAEFPNRVNVRTNIFVIAIVAPIFEEVLKRQLSGTYAIGLFVFLESITSMYASLQQDGITPIGVLFMFCVRCIFAPWLHFTCFFMKFENGLALHMYNNLFSLIPWLLLYQDIPLCGVYETCLAWVRYIPADGEVPTFEPGTHVSRVERCTFANTIPVVSIFPRQFASPRMCRAEANRFANYTTWLHLEAQMNVTTDDVGLTASALEDTIRSTPSFAGYTLQIRLMKHWVPGTELRSRGNRSDVGFTTVHKFLFVDVYVEECDAHFRFSVVKFIGWDRALARATQYWMDTYYGQHGEHLRVQRWCSQGGLHTMAGLPDTWENKLLTDLILFAGSFIGSDTCGKLFSVMNFVHNRCGASTVGPTLRSYFEVLDTYLQQCSVLAPPGPPEVWSHNFQWSDPNVLQLESQAMPSFGDVGQFLKGVFRSSPLRAALQLVTFMYASVMLFHNSTFDVSAVAALQTKMMEYTKIDEVGDLFGNVWKWISVLVHTGEEFISTRDWRVLLRNDDEGRRIMDTVEQLDVEFVRLKLDALYCQPVIAYKERIDGVYKDIDKFALVCRTTWRAPMLVAKKRVTTMQLDAELLLKQLSFRLAPFSVLLSAGSSIGKSSVQAMIIESFRALNPLSRELKVDVMPTEPLNEDGIYTRTTSSTRWDGYRNNVWCVVLDDIAQANPRNVPTFALEANEIVKIVNNVAYLPEMPDLESKGKIMLAPQLVIATTNTVGLNAYHAVNAPFAVLRRFPLVVIPTVKSDYATDGKLDPAKVPEGRASSFMWTFEVQTPVLSGSITYRTLLGPGVETNELMTYLSNAASEHFKQQVKLSKSVASMRCSNVCERCLCIPQVCCCPVSNLVAPVLNPEAPEFVSQSFEPPPVSPKLLEVLPQYLWVVLFYMLLQHLKYFLDGFLLLNGALVRRVRAWMDGRVADAYENVPTAIVLAPARLERFLWRRYTRAVMTRVNNFVPSKRTLTMIAAISAGGVLLYMSGLLSGVSVKSPPKRRFHASQGGEQSRPAGEVPPPVAANVNPWIITADVSAQQALTHHMRTSNPASFTNILTRQIGQFWDDNGSFIMGINLWGTCWILPRHWMDDNVSRGATVTLARNHCNFVANSTFIVAKERWHPHPSKDCGIYNVPTIPGRDLTEYIPAKALLHATGKYLLMRSDDEVPRVDSGKRVEETAFVPARLARVNISSETTRRLKIETDLQHYTFELAPKTTKSGDCGSPYFRAEVGASILWGFHLGANDEGFVGALPFDKEWILGVRQTTGFVSNSDDSLSMILKNVRGKPDFELVKMHSRCPLRCVGLADKLLSCEFIGTVKGYVGMSFHSNIARNRYADFWESNGYSTKKLIPRLPPGCSYLPKRNFLLNACMQKETFPPDVVSAAAAHYLARLEARLDPMRICVLSDNVAMHGIPGDQSFSPMAFSKSAGWPWRIAKKYVFTSLGEGVYEIPSDLEERIGAMTTLLREHKRCGIVFTSTLKDEPISATKLAEGKIRVFQAVNVEGLFLIRKYFLAIVVALQEQNFVSELAVSINCESADWDVLHDYIFIDTWKIICGDYSNFDQRMALMLLQAAWGILIDYCAKLKRDGFPVFTADDIVIMRGLAFECCCPIQDFFGDLLAMCGSNPSGHPLTVIINSIVNSLYIRIAYLLIFSTLVDFDEFVRLMNYGDDNSVSVAPAKQDDFNQITISTVLGKFGVVYTDASKDGVLRKFSEDVSFLKRGWVWDADMKVYLAPLAWDSVCRMLILGHVNSGAVEQDRLCAVLKASLDASFQHGKQVFLAHRSLVLKCIEEFQLGPFMARNGGTPTYEYYVEDRLVYKCSSNLGVSYHARLMQKQRAPVAAVTSILPSFELHSAMDVRGSDVRDQGQTPESLIQGGVWSSHGMSSLGGEECAPSSNTLAETNTNTELSHFADAGAEVYGAPVAIEQKTPAPLGEGELAKWFARPRTIKEYKWDEGVPMNWNFQPWDDFFRHANVRNKLKGYAFIKNANLHIRFTASTAMTRYGMLMASYKPLWDGSGGHTSFSRYPYFSGGTILEDVPATSGTKVPYPGGNAGAVRGNTRKSRMVRSQRPHAIIDLTQPEGVEMVLPFLHYHDGIEMLDSPDVNGYTAAALREMGTVFLEQIVGLHSSGPANTNGVRITVHMWATNVVLAGATPLTSQGFSEFDETPSGKLSEIASAVASAAGRLTRVPKIGSWARATEMVASGVASTLRLFGWTAPPLVTPVPSVLPRCGWLVANSQIHQADEVLAFDPMCGTSVDPATVGAYSGDELNIDWLCGLPSIIDVVRWDASDPRDTLLYQLPVTPCAYFESSLLDGIAGVGTDDGRLSSVVVHQTPSCYIANMFDKWRGTAHFKFSVSCSAMHTGRIRISWDPIFLGGDVYVPTDGARVTEIWDISKGKEFIFSVPMNCNTGFLDTMRYFHGALDSSSTEYTRWGARGSPTGFTMSNRYIARQFTNGMVNVSVSHELQDAMTISPAYIVCRVHFSDVQFMGPMSDQEAYGPDSHITVTNGGNGNLNTVGFSPFTSQGGKEDCKSQMETAPCDAVQRAVPFPVDSGDHHALLYGGERIVSLRTLMQRTALYTHLVADKSYPPTDATNTMKYKKYWFRWKLPRFPVPFGAKGYYWRHKATGVINSTVTTPASTLFNFHNTIPLSYVTACFVGYRGSIVWRVTKMDELALQSKLSILVKRTTASILPASGGDKVRIFETVPAEDGSVQEVKFNSLWDTSFSGGAYAGSHQDSVNAVVPMYAKMRMFPANMPTMPFGYGATMQSDHSSDMISISATTSGVNWSAASGGSMEVHLAAGVAAGHDYTPFYFVSIPEFHVPVYERGISVTEAV